MEELNLNKNINMKIAKVRDVKSPVRNSVDDAGIDFFIPNDIGWESYTLSKHQSINIESGIRANVPKGYALIVYNKSGQALKKRIAIGASVIDHSYQGIIHIHIYNSGDKEVTIFAGEKIVQMLLVPVSHEMIEEVSEEDLYDSISERGNGGFGSTGT